MNDREEAIRLSEELKKIDRPYSFGNHTYWRARIVSVLGDKEQAVALLRESFTQGKVFGSYLFSEPDFIPLKDYKPFKALIQPKE